MSIYERGCCCFLQGYDGFSCRVSLAEHFSATLSMESESNQQFLAEACQRGDLAAVKDLVGQGVSLESPAESSTGFTALGIATYCGHSDVVEFLLEAGACIDPPCKHSPLQIAAAKRHVRIAQCLVKAGANTERISDDLPGTPLFTAVGLGHLEIVQCLVKGGCELNNRYQGGLSALSRAALMGDMAMVQCLVRGGADKNFPPDDPPLLNALSDNHFEVAEYLMEVGADVGWPGEGPNVILAAAGLTGNIEIVRKFKEAGGDLDRVTTETGMTLLASTVAKGNTALAKCLIGAGTGLDNTCFGGWTPLCSAAAVGSLDGVKLLVGVGASLELPGSPEGETPLLAAIYNGQTDVAAFLLGAGAVRPPSQV